jgi:tRNA threonylcarbamoyladenosine biosynthesis protein TsaE
MSIVTTASASPAQTAQLAAELAGLLGRGDVLVLTGGLAAGKTYFVQQLVKALGSTDAVVSPTFAIANFYQTPVAPFIHVDAYRLSGTREYADLGLDEYREDSITAIEWGDRLPGAFDEYLGVDFQLSDTSDEGRIITFRPLGRRWETVAGRLGSLPGPAK